MKSTNNYNLLQNADLKEKIVLVRVDHNVVKKGIIHDPYRIDATIGTLYYINAKGGKIILMSHVGRPRNKANGNITINNDTSVLPIVDYLKSNLHIEIKVPEFHPNGTKGFAGIETSVNHLIKELKEDAIDAIYLPNTRWFSGEESKDETCDRLAYQLAGLADIFVNDAFGSWQAHASTVNIANYLPSCAGFLMQKEIENLERIFNPSTPFLAVVAGAKFDTKIASLYALLDSADYLILGGVIYNTYLAAKYGFKIKGISDNDLRLAKKFVKYAENYADKLIELPFVVSSTTIENKTEGKYKTVDIRKCKKGTALDYICDIAEESFKVPQVVEVFHKAKTVFVNAVMGLTPYFNDGTIALDQLIDKNAGAIKLYGGGDTLQELKRLLPGLYITALDCPNYYIFTGGGAVLKAIQEGTPLKIAPVKALINNKKKYK